LKLTGADCPVPHCSGLGSTSEVLEQTTTAAAGTITIRKVPGKLTWSNLVLERGIERSAKLWNWRQLVVDGKVAEARKNGALVAMSQDGASLMRWDFVNGWPCAWRVFSTEDASGLAVERLEVDLAISSIRRRMDSWWRLPGRQCDPAGS